MNTQRTIRNIIKLIKCLPSSTFRLSTIASPDSLPPVTKLATAPGIPFFSSMLETIFVTAIAHKGVVGEGFQIVVLPAARDRARFLDHDRNLSGAGIVAQK